MSDEVQTASQGCHRTAAAFYYKSKSRGEQDTKDWHTQKFMIFLQIQIKGQQDTRETEILILKVKGTLKNYENESVAAFILFWINGKLKW